MKLTRTVRRFLLGYLILHILAAGVFAFVLNRITRNHLKSEAQTRISAMALVMDEHIAGLNEGVADPSLLDYIKQTGDRTKARFTLINFEGEIIVDSIIDNEDAAKNANVDSATARFRGNREEVKLANKEGTGFSERFSSTLNRQMIYHARKLPTRENGEGGGFIRVATPLAAIDSSLVALRTYFWIFTLSLGALTGLVMTVFATRAIGPLNVFASSARQIGAGNYELTPNITRFKDEWGELGEAFQQMQSELNSREDRLAENGQRLEAVLSSMIEGVIAIDPDGRVMLANGAACEMLALTRPEIVKRKLLEIVRIPDLRTAIESTQLHRTFSKTEFKTLTKPQKTLSARVSILADESTAGIVVVVHDVTALRQLETMRRDFVANVSHELKTPLASIKAYAETLRLGAIHDDEKNLQFVGQIESQADLLNAQIQDLLELARVETGEAAFSISNVDINSVCKSCFEQFSRSTQKLDLEFKLNLDESEPLAKADISAIETIVKNLVVNAIHYTPEGSITIESSVEDQEVMIKVIDTGIGIAEDQHSRVFERFYRVDRARSRDMGGTGLGLAIVKHLTQSFGGTINLQSQPGKGSTFEVRLPKSSDWVI